MPLDLDALIARTAPPPRAVLPRKAPVPAAVPDWSTRPPALTFTRFRSCQAQEGEAWSADLAIDGVKAAFVEEGGFGGPMTYDWTPSGGGYHRPSALGAALIAYVDALPPTRSPWPEGAPESERPLLPVGLDCFVAGCLDAQKQEESYRRACRNHIVFRLPDDKEGTYRKIKMNWPADGERFRAWAAQRYPGVAVEIVNERFDVRGREA